MNTEQEIRDVCQEVEALLLSKNRSYGDSAFDPVRIFSKADDLEQINVRIDDKLSRVAKGNGDLGEDTDVDLVGYIILRIIGRRRLAVPLEMRFEFVADGEAQL